MSTNDLAITTYPDVESAPKYNAPEFMPAEVTQACIIRKGTEAGRSTIDLVFVDGRGQKYMAMITGRIVVALASAIGDEP